MKRSLAILFTAAALAGCSSGSSSPDASTGATTERPTSTSAKARAVPKWVDDIAAGDVTVAPKFEGHDVWVDESNQVVIAEDCEVARKATREGGPYGPEPRNEDGSGGKAGYAHACKN